MVNIMQTSIYYHLKTLSGNVFVRDKFYTDGELP